MRINDWAALWGEPTDSCLESLIRFVQPFFLDIQIDTFCKTFECEFFLWLGTDVLSAFSAAGLVAVDGGDGVGEVVVSGGALLLSLLFELFFWTKSGAAWKSSDL